LGGDGEPERLMGALVTADFPETLGVRPSSDGPSPLQILKAARG